MIKYFFIVVISFFLFINLNIYAQENETFKYKTNDKPPAGFEDLLNDTNYGYIDIYFVNKYIGSFQSEYNMDTITFYDYEEIFNLLSEEVTFINKEQIKEILNNPLPVNSQYICEEINECEIFNPEIIGVVFDKRTLSSTFYINYDHVEEEKVNYKKLLPNSTSEHSYLQSFNFNFFKNQDSDLTYSLLGNSTYAYKEHRLKSTWLKNQDDFFVSQFYYGNDSNGKTTRLGYINSNSFGYTFTPNLRMLGLEYSTSINTRKDLQTEFSEPIPIFLNERAAVKILVNGELIYSEYLEAGNQIINTTNFPSGSYNLNIEVIEDNGNTRKFQKFFVKSISIPPKDEDLFYFNLGYIESEELSIFNNTEEYENSVFPEVENDLFFKFGHSTRWNSQTAIYSEVLYQSDDYLYNPTLYFLGNGYEIRSSFMLGNHKAKGLTFDFNMPFYDKNLSLFFRYINDNDNKFSSKEGISLSAVYSMNLSDYGSLSFFGNYEKSLVNDFNNKTYTLSYRNNFYQTQKGSLNFNFDISKNNNETFINLGFTYNFNANNNLNFRTTPTWRKRENGSDYNITNNVRYNKNNKNTEYSHNITTNNSEDSKNVLVNNIISDQRYGNATLDVNYDYSNSEDKKLSLLGSFNTNIGTDGKNYTFGGKRRLESGIIIDLTNYNLEDEFQLYINNIPTDKVKSSKVTFIPLNPYSEYSIYLKSLSEDNFIKVRSKRELVTLYPGNIETLEWNIDRIQLITGQLFDQYGNIIKSKTVYANSNKTFTDDFGFFQLEVTDIDDKIWVEFDKNDCVFDFNKIEREDIMYFDEVICYYNSDFNRNVAIEKVEVENKKYEVINID